jgi:hypothetical protein
LPPARVGYIQRDYAERCSGVYRPVDPTEREQLLLEGKLSIGYADHFSWFISLVVGVEDNRTAAILRRIA